LRQHVVFFKDHLVLEGEQGTAIGGQRGGHGSVAGHGLRFVIVVGKDCVHVQLRRQPWNFSACDGVAHHQAAPHLLQLRRQFADAGMDEFHTAVRPRQGVKDFLVINESAKHGFAALQRVVQGGMVKAAQIAAEPYQSSAKRHRAWGIISDSRGGHYVAIAAIPAIHSKLSAIPPR
jgi:hypothetical protein